MHGAFLPGCRHLHSCKAAAPVATRFVNNFRILSSSSCPVPQQRLSISSSFVWMITSSWLSLGGSPPMEVVSGDSCPEMADPSTGSSSSHGEAGWVSCSSLSLSFVVSQEASLAPTACADPCFQMGTSPPS